MVREAEHPSLTHASSRFRVQAYFHIYWSKSKIIFDARVKEGCSASLTTAREKQT
jgi:hypothetical protein